MKILVVCQYYEPEPFRITDICRDMIRRGHDITVLCGIPNYPAGRFYPGYSLFHRRKETVDGIRIIRSFVIPRGKGGKIGLSLNYLSFLASAWVRHFRLARQNFDAVFCFALSPMTMALPAVAVARRARIPFTLYVADLWPENVEAVNGIHNRRILNALGRMTGYIYRHCDRIMVSSRRFSERMMKWGADPDRIVYWPQYAEDFYTPAQNPVETPSPYLAEFPVVFTGNIGVAQGLDVLIEAARRLSDLPAAVFYLVGDGRARVSLETRVREAGLQEKIVFCGRVPGELVPSYLARAGAALLTMAPDPVFSLYLPLKLQTYLACGVPILCAADGAAADVVNQAGAGLTARSGDAAGLADAVRRFSAMPLEERTQMGHNARACYDREYTKVRLMDELEDWLLHPRSAGRGGNVG